MPRFCTYPLNYHNNRTSPIEAADNNYNTFTTSGSITCNIDSVGDGTGDEREFTTVYVIGQNISTIAFTVGATPITHTVPTTVKNDVNEDIPIDIIDGLQRILIEIPYTSTKPLDTSLTFTISGTSARVYDLMVLNEIFRVEGNFRVIEPDWNIIDSGLLQEAPGTGRSSWAPALNNERDKWSVSQRLVFQKLGKDDYRNDLITLIRFMREYKHFTLIDQPPRYPLIAFPAIFPERTKQLRYLSQVRSVGASAAIDIREM